MTSHLMTSDLTTDQFMCSGNSVLIFTTAKLHTMQLFVMSGNSRVLFIKWFIISTIFCINKTEQWQSNSPEPVSWTHRWPSPRQGSISSAPGGNGSGHCKWGRHAGSPGDPGPPGQRGFPVVPIVAARWSADPLCSGTSHCPLNYQCSGCLKQRTGVMQGHHYG